MNHSAPLILLAIADSSLHSELTQIAAAIGHRTISATDERDIARLSPRAVAVCVDSDHAGTITSARRLQRCDAAVLFVCLDPGPLDYPEALACQAQQAFIIPSHNKELLAALGALTSTSQSKSNEAGFLVGAGNSASDAIPEGPVGPLSRATESSFRPPPPETGAHRLDSPVRTVEDRHHRKSKHSTIAVVATGGGAGASTLAGAIARTAARSGHGPVTVVDAVDNSGGLDLLFGIEDSAGLRWPDLHLGEGSINANDLRECLPRTDDDIAVLTCARGTTGHERPQAGNDIDTVLATLKAEPGLTVVDAHALDIPQAVDSVVLVCPAEVRCVAMAAEISQKLVQLHTPFSVIVRHRRWSSLTPADIEELVHSEVIAEIGTISSLTKHTETHGLARRIPKPLSIAAHAVLADTVGEQGR